MDKNSPFERVGRMVSILMACVVLGGCFLFNGGKKQGFEIEGVWDGDDTSTDIGGCTSSDLQGWLVAFTGDSFDSPSAPDSGSLRFSVVGDCFPSDASSGFATFEFVSPNLFSKDYWDGVSEIGFAMKTNLPGVWVQPLLEVGDGAGGSVYLREVDPKGSPVFHSLTRGADWEDITFTRPGTLSEPVIRIRIRVFVENDTIGLYAGPEAVVFLDTIRSL